MRSEGTGRHVVIVGGGHNGLTSAAYLARAGHRVTVLERLDHVGGAAISAEAFAGVPARLSRYSYLVSLMPRSIADDLGLSVRLVRRRYSSYTPLPGTDRGLLIDNRDAAATAASFASVGAGADAAGFSRFHARTGEVARNLFPTLTRPLPTESEARALFGADWGPLVERPIGEAISEAVASDLVRGVIATDALIGTFASVFDAGLEQNRCLLYHVIGQGTGDWDVPIGGMGVVSGGIEAAARAAGATIVTGAEVTSVMPDGEVVYRAGDADHRVGADLVLAGCAPAVLARLMGEDAPRPQGAQVKVNMLLRRLPRLREAGLDPRAAFGGTFHVHESLPELERAWAVASGGEVPDPLPLEIYCHSLADRSILGAELGEDAQTLTVFGLHVPDALVDAVGNDELRSRLQRAVFASLDSVLGEPLEPLLAVDPAGHPCVEVRTTRDLEASLAMPGGQIFHGPLAWPWAEADEPLDTPACRWGVATAHERVLLCGAGARRGGGVSGVGGHNAAMASLELLG